MRRRAPDVVAVGAFELPGSLPCLTVARPYRITEVLVDLVLLTWQHPRAGIPGARIDEQLVLEAEKVGIARISLRNRKAMFLIVRCKNEGKPFQRRGLRDFSSCPV